MKQKGNDANARFDNIDKAKKYMQTAEYKPDNFLYTDVDKHCVYIKKDGVVSDYLMQGYDCSLEENRIANRETVPERNNGSNICK